MIHRGVLLGETSAVIDYCRVIWPGLTVVANCEAVGLMWRGELCGGLFLHGYQEGLDGYIAAATTNPRALSRAAIQVFLRYLFNELKLPHATAEVHDDNHRCRKLLEGVGFQHHCMKRNRVHVYGLIPSDIRKGLI